MYRGEAVAMGCCLDIVCLVHNVQVWFCILLRVCVCVCLSVSGSLCGLAGCISVPVSGVNCCVLSLRWWYFF